VTHFWNRIEDWEGTSSFTPQACGDVDGGGQGDIIRAGGALWGAEISFAAVSAGCWMSRLLG